MAPKVSEEYLEARRQQILDAAVVCFSRRGFYLTTLEDIHKKAGLSKGAVYHYFKSKEDIIDALRSRSAKDDASILANTECAESPVARLVQLTEFTYRRMLRPESGDANRLSVFLSAEAMLNRRIWEGQMASIRPAL
ncbi:MAG: TetR/AcrR family transcriptional regulator, partial [Chloroflexi bacterium]|nr:TetR/AcrR family transcriptional regulator [Chloroflexota bacterium]